MQLQLTKPEKWVPRVIRSMLGKDQINTIDRLGYQFSEPVTTLALTGNTIEGARTRQVIYAKYQRMACDPLISGAIRLHVTAALGGHETSGDLVFIESTPEAKKVPALEAEVAKLSKELAPIFNRLAMPAAYNAAIYGDAYARIYSKPRIGITDMSIDEMFLPPLCIPFEQGNATRVVVVATGDKARQPLAMDQIARVKMPRMIYTPQPVAIEKAWRMQITKDSEEDLELMPSLVGGSFLADAEIQYNNFAAALAGLVGQRVLDSIDESMFVAQVQGMTREQQQKFMGSLARILTKSKEVADAAVKSGLPVMQRIRHIIPTWGEKQVVGIQGVNSGGGTGGGRSGNITIDDVMFHAKLLCGALGIDISMLGFADLMSGGLGDGGFFRTSAQAAERSRTIRVALADFFYHCIDIHLIKKTGSTYTPETRPYQINFYGTISALETERVKTQLDAINTGTMLAQCFELVKNTGLDEESMAHMFERVMKIDAEDAKLYAKALAKAKKEQEAREAQQNAFGGGGGGDFGGGDFGGGDDDPPADEEDPPGAPKPVPTKSK